MVGLHSVDKNIAIRVSTQGDKAVLHSSIIRSSILLLHSTAAFLLPHAASAASFIVSEAEAFAQTWVTETDQTIAEGSDSDESNTPGDLAVAEATATGCLTGDNSQCAVIPEDPPNGAVARARTDYGSNRAYARSNHFDVGGTVSHVDSAGARSTWADAWTLGGNVTGQQDFMITLRADGDWRGQGMFALQVLIVDGNEILYGDEDLPIGTVAQGTMTNACGWDFDVGIDLGCDPIVLPPGFPPITGESFVDVNPDGDNSGDFDHFLQVSAPWVTGKTYQVIVTLAAGTGPSDNSRLDAESTARITQVLIPQGGTLTSEAGALANYNVAAVPVPAVGWIVGAALAGIGLRARVRRAR